MITITGDKLGNSLFVVLTKILLQSYLIIMNENQVISSLLNEKKTALESLKKKIHQVETEN